MIIVLKQGTTKDQISTFSNELNQTYGVTVNAWYGEHSTVLGLLGDTAKIDIEYIRAQAIVESVKRVQEPYKKANRKFHPEQREVRLKFLQRDVLLNFVGERGQQGCGHARQQQDCGGRDDL